MSNDKHPTALGSIPQSPALAEATIDSLAEIISRDPEGYQRQDRDRIVAALRADRGRREAAEQAAAAKGGARAKPKGVKISEVGPKPSAEDLGL